MTPGDFVMIQAIFLQLSGPIGNMGFAFREIDQSSVDLEDLFHMLQQKPLVSEAPDAKEFEFKGGQIQFKNCNFSHYTMETNKKDDGTDERELIEKPIINDFSLDIKAGTTNAIVGQSGFGKTTLLNILYRIYDPQDGSVMIDG